MARIRSKDTIPEVEIRKLIHGMGFRFRLHRRDLPGTPDLAFISRRKVIFVHGCFWHVHDGCKNAILPKSNVEFWQKKLSANHARDVRNLNLLHECGWDVLTIWECELADLECIRRKIKDFLVK